jgi:hypothetical protein
MNETTSAPEGQVGPRRGISRAAALGLVALFVGPLAMAIYAFTHLEDWGPEAYVNNGVLIAPARPLEGLGWTTPAGESVTVDALRGRWTLVQVGDATCGLPCRAALFKTRQGRLALGREMTRVQRVYVLTDAAALAGLESLFAEHPDMRVVFADGMQAEGLSQFGNPLRDQIFVVDPLGNLMMRYDTDARTKGLLKDMKRLLKVSQIG